jgi:probable HAF family extracellular repeat protein
VYSEGIGPSGLVTGYLSCALGSGKKAYLWDGTSLTLIVLPPPFNSGTGVAVNSAGVCAGWMNQTNNSAEVPFVTVRGVASVLPFLPGDIGGQATSINEANVVAGWTGNNGLNAVRWFDGKVEALRLPVGPESRALDINDAGQICGWMGTSAGSNSSAFLWEDGVAADLSVLDGATVAYALNNKGEVAGQGQVLVDGVLRARAVVWTKSETMVFEPLLGYLHSQAFDINDEAVVVGQCFTPVTATAFVWQKGEMFELQTLVESESGVTIEFVTGINNAGQISAYGEDADEEHVAILLTPIPPVPGDLTCDWVVDGEDLGLLLAAWDSADAKADLNGDGVVDGADLGVLLVNWTE